MKIRNIAVSALALLGSMFTLSGCAAAADQPGGTSTMFSMLWIIGLFVIMYVVMIIPENKRKKKAQQMRDTIEVGDKIVTIGGIIGKVVHVSEERITIETGEDRVRVELTKWAVSSNEGKGANKETTDSEETLDN